MRELQKEAYGPGGDATLHLQRTQLETGLASLKRAPTEVGSLLLIVRRRSDGHRETPGSVFLSEESGVAGDGWSRRPPRDPNAQLAVMRGDIATLIANGQPLTVFGDNLFVDLDLSAQNSPTGTTLTVGGAMVVVSPKPHNGCAKFKARFGADALQFVQDAPTRPENRRGIYWQVVRVGTVRIGDSVVVVSRADEADRSGPLQEGTADA